MGSGPSSYKNNNELSFLVHKKITTLKPTYLTYEPYYYEKNKICLSFKESSNAKIKIKINRPVSFYIDDIIGYCYNEASVYTYDYHLTFLHDINESDIEIINMSDNEDAINIFNKIYDDKGKKFKWFNLSKFVYTRSYFFTTLLKEYDTIHYMKNMEEDENKLKYFLEKYVDKDKFLIEELKDEDLDNLNDFTDNELNNKTHYKTNYKTNYKKNCDKFSRILDYQNYTFFNKSQLPDSLIEPSKKKKPLLTFFIMFIIIGLLNFIISKEHKFVFL